MIEWLLVIVGDRWLVVTWLKWNRCNPLVQWDPNCSNVILFCFCALFFSSIANRLAYWQVFFPLCFLIISQTKCINRWNRFRLIRRQKMIIQIKQRKLFIRYILSIYWSQIKVNWMKKRYTVQYNIRCCLACNQQLTKFSSKQNIHCCPCNIAYTAEQQQS